MAKNDNLTDYLTGLADKLRGLLGQTEKMNPQSFEEKIQEVYDLGFASGGPDAASITATAEQVVSGKTFGAGGQELRTGTMPLRVTGQAANSCVLRDETLYYRLPHGCWPNTYSNTECEAGMGQAAVAEAIGLTEDKLVSGQTVLGVTGTGRSRVETICTIGTNNSSYKSACNQKSTDTTNMTMTMSGAERTVTFKNAGYFTWHTTGTNGTSVYTNSTYTKGLMNKVAAGKSVTFGISGSGSNFFVLSVAFMPE